MVDLKELKTMGAEGFIGFSVKAKDTEENVAIHEGFKNYCLHNARSDYTQGLRLLLEKAVMLEDMETEQLMNKIVELENRIIALEKSDKKEVKTVF